MILGEKVYFDHNATTPLLKEVREATEDIAHLPLNPSSVHSYGRYAKKLLEDARNEVANALCATDQYKTVFTASGTEANNLAITGMKEYKCITSQIEHPAVLKVVGEGLIPIDSNGVIKLDVLEQILSTSDKPILISVIMASNEIGVIQPIHEVVKIARKYKALVHTDASQYIGKAEINVAELDADMVTICGHKFGAPVGVGALIFKKQLPLTSIMKGGGQEFRFRPGTQNILAIHGLGVACSKIKQIIASFTKLEKYRDFLEEEIMRIAKDSIIFGKNAARMPNVSSFSMPGVNNETQVIHFDLNGFAVSTGAACSSGRVDLPYVHMAMGYEQKQASCAIRVSMGIENTLEQVKKFIKVWQDLYLKTRLTDAA
ncbi:cysteine desulfurase 2 [endosymbiont of Acanthamoeba sp. UWC8]|uniref:cysteine desulfurase family protein n=1 Tax=endosymbiont of Acanthamoeba sp. UWC8 TaxID=86106 RepID=UPI0004D1F3DB|nr:cysteine desulfurase family protein [endosymbiont of Acanthamoeba sp. UWC8]AIF81814.1 cysteine desulfurase 2 [endosymbiont of Acanthamoeba sp. UWC8]